MIYKWRCDGSSGQNQNFFVLTTLQVIVTFLCTLGQIHENRQLDFVTQLNLYLKKKLRKLQRKK